MNRMVWHESIMVIFKLLFDSMQIRSNEHIKLPNFVLLQLLILNNNTNKKPFHEYYAPISSRGQQTHTHEHTCDFHSFLVFSHKVNKSIVCVSKLFIFVQRIENLSEAVECVFFPPPSSSLSNLLFFISFHSIFVWFAALWCIVVMSNRFSVVVTDANTREREPNDSITMKLERKNKKIWKRKMKKKHNDIEKNEKKMPR